VTAPIPEERDEATLPTEGTPPGEHGSELPDDADGGQSHAEEREQEHNAETTEEQPSQ
jgi:hypothetical protein